jgi:hypothetical protein
MAGMPLEANILLTVNAISKFINVNPKGFLLILLNGDVDFF